MMLMTDSISIAVVMMVLQMAERFSIGELAEMFHLRVSRLCHDKALNRKQTIDCVKLRIPKIRFLIGSKRCAKRYDVLFGEKIL